MSLFKGFATFTQTPIPIPPTPTGYSVNFVFNAFNTGTNQKTVDLYFTRASLSDILIGTFTYSGATFSGTTSTVQVPANQIPSPNFYGFTQKWCSNTGNAITRINDDWELYQNGVRIFGPGNTILNGNIPVCPTKTNGPSGFYSVFPLPVAGDTLTFYVTSSFV